MAVFGDLGGLVVLAGLWILARPPVLLKLGADDVAGTRAEDRLDGHHRGRAGRGRPRAGDRAADQAKDEHSVLIPLSWLAPAKVDKLEAELRERLNKANGYTIWDGTAREPG